MLCPNCSNPIDDNSVFCSKCGQAVSPNAQPAEERDSNHTGEYYADSDGFVNPTGYNDSNYGPSKKFVISDSGNQQKAQFHNRFNPNNTYAGHGYEQPYVNEPTPTPPQPPVPPALPMKWFNFLIYFALFASAFFCFITGISNFISGINYESFFTVIAGLINIGLAAFAILVRTRLAGFYKNGPSLLKLFYIADIAITVINLFISLITAATHGYSIDFSSTILGLIASGIILALNETYFKKRKNLFTK